MSVAIPSYNFPFGRSLPSKPVKGSVHYNKNLNCMMEYNGESWQMIAPCWYLFIDDLREPSSVGWSSDSVVVARSSQEAVAAIESRPTLPAQISFDHDLGGDDTTFTFMWFLINGHLDQKWNLADVQNVIIHTANIVGREKLVGLWESFCKSQQLSVPLNVCPAFEAKDE